MRLRIIMVTTAGSAPAADDRGVAIETVRSFDAALVLLASETFDAIVVETSLMDTAPLRWFDDLRRVAPGTRLVSASLGAVQSGAAAALIELDPTIPGWSAAWDDVLRRARKLAVEEGPVLLASEAGTEIEALARVLHAAGPRGSEPFTILPAATAPRDAIESLVFPATPATGVLLIEEVAAMPTDLQGRLAGALADRGPLGGRRILASVTLRRDGGADPEYRLDGRLRERLGTELRVPPLRDRGDDIPRLARAFLATAALSQRRPAGAISPAAVGLLQRYDWPGNTRELANIIERAVLVCRGTEIGAEDLLLPGAGAAAPGGETLAIEPALTYDRFIKEATADAARRYLTMLLERCDGNVSQAAREAGIERASFHRLLRRHGLDAGAFRRKGPKGA